MSRHASSAHYHPAHRWIEVKSTKDYESIAQVTLQRLLGGQVRERDTAGAQGMRDFDLVDQDEMVVHAIEVTSVQLERVRATQSAIEKVADQDLGLRQSWSVTMHEEGDLRPVRVDAGRLLNQLTALGVSRFEASRPGQEAASPTEREILAELHDIGLIAGTALPGVSPPRLTVRGYGTGFLDPLSVTISVESELDKKDNRRKLAEAPEGSTRHLFVWLDDSKWSISSVVREMTFPLPPAPLLPPEIDVCWIAAGEGGEAPSVLMIVDGEGIRSLDPVSGDEVPLVLTTAVSGPPYPPAPCPVCQSPGRWTTAHRARTAPDGQRSTAKVWEAVCSVREGHWRLPGRELSRRELATLGSVD